MKKINKASGAVLVEYSEKSLAVVGETYPIKEYLRQAGGKFNRYLKIDGKPRAGWIFSKNRSQELKNIFDNLEKK